jgi:hypothetical protein
MFYEPKAYWEDRLTRDFSLGGVGTSASANDTTDGSIGENCAALKRRFAEFICMTSGSSTWDAEQAFS